MDYAHSIALGYVNESAYGNAHGAGRASAGLHDVFQIGKIRVDGEFNASSAFKAFCLRKNMVLCPSVAYTHTMQARAEGAVSTCKEHSLQLLAGSFDTATLGGNEGLQ
eukprot:717089-Rhodomonas_salina.1